MYPKALLSHPNFLSERSLWHVGKVVATLSVIPTDFCSAERSFSVLGRPKTNLSSTMGQDCLRHLALSCIERVYFNRLDIGKVIDGFSSKKVVSSSFSNQFLDKKRWWFILGLIKSDLVNSTLAKGNLNLSYWQKTWT